MVDVGFALSYCQCWHVAFAVVQNKPGYSLMVFANCLGNRHGLLVGSARSDRHISQCPTVYSTLGSALARGFFVCTARNSRGGVKLAVFHTVGGREILAA